jgi:glycosyltransferase involved in cell wall biosynthesis
VCRRADAVLVQAPGLVDRLVESYPFCRDRVAWIPNNIEPSLWPPTGGNGFRGSSKTLSLLSIGGFSWGKGSDRLVEFMRRCLQKGIDVRARWVGNASKMDRAWLIGECESKGVRSRIEFEQPGSRERLSRLYRESDYLFHASRLDGSPRVVLEALFHGLPVIASNHPGIEVLDPEKRFIHFWNENAGDLVDAIQRERGEQSRYRERSESGARYVTDCFTSGCVSAKYVELYERLLDGRGMAS